MSTAESPFSFAPPSTPSALLQIHLPSSPLLPRLISLSDTLYTSLVNRQVKREVAQLRGELRDEYRHRSRAVKADWMARLVPSQPEAEEDSSVDEDLQKATLEEHPDREDEPNLVPTILSDADEAAKMSSAVDAQVAAALEQQENQASVMVSESVRKTVGMELELWLGQAVRCLRFPLSLPTYFHLSLRSSTLLSKRREQRMRRLRSLRLHWRIGFLRRASFCRISCRWNCALFPAFPNLSLKASAAHSVSSPIHRYEREREQKTSRASQLDEKLLEFCKTEGAGGGAVEDGGKQRKASNSRL
jgi:hypothetical protein